MNRFVGFADSRSTLPAVARRVTFVRRRGLYPLLLQNVALNAITLSFYRFWARTARRRHYWS